MSTFGVPSADVICQPSLRFGLVLYERENLLGEYVGPATSPHGQPGMGETRLTKRIAAATADTVTKLGFTARSLSLSFLPGKLLNFPSTFSGVTIAVRSEDVMTAMSFCRTRKKK